MIGKENEKVNIDQVQTLGVAKMKNLTPTDIEI